MVPPDLYATEHACLQCSELLGVETDFVTGAVNHVRCRLARDLRVFGFPIRAFQGRGVSAGEPVCCPQAALRNRRAMPLLVFGIPLDSPFDKEGALADWLVRQTAGAGIVEA